MRQMQLAKPGGLDKFKLNELDIPKPKDNEILIRNPFEAISLDCLDLHHRLKNKDYNQSTIKEIYQFKTDGK